MDNKNITSVELNDETLDKVTGGTQTGDVKDNKVWINFPFPVNYMSGYKSCDDIISLANNFYGYKDSIIPNINDDVRLAVQNLFSLNNREMPTNVKEFLGM